jgi:uncharacterized protein (UPF0332 family)
LKTEIRVDIARYRIEKANKNLVEARDSFALGHHELTVGRSYYCVFIAMKALLALEGIDTKSHAGTFTLFNKHFMKGNLFPRGFSKVIRDAKRIREKSEYGEFQTVERDIAELHLKNADEFLRRVEVVVRERLLSMNGK